MDILNCAKSKFITNKCNNNQDVNLRQEKHLSMERLSKITGLSRYTIDKIEHSRINDFRLSTLQKIANALEVDIIEIIHKK